MSLVPTPTSLSPKLRSIFPAALRVDNLETHQLISLLTFTQGPKWMRSPSLENSLVLEVSVSHPCVSHADPTLTEKKK